METNNKMALPLLFLLFKSYYVVWKQILGGTISVQAISFKSYYVVWKLLFTLLVFILFLLFKSYYVVWKPDSNWSVWSR